MPLRNNLLSYNHESVETNIGSWFANNGNTTLTRDTAQAFEGAASQKLASVAAGNISSGLTGILVQPGRTFTISCWVWTSTASLTSRIDVDWYTGNGAGSYISTSSTANIAIPTSTWTLVSMVATSPATAGEARLFVGQATATGAGQVMFVDSAFVGIAGDVIEPSRPGPAPNPSSLWHQAPPVATFDPAAASVTEVGNSRYVTANATTVVTDSFTPADGSLLVACCSMGNGAGSASSLGAVTDSLGGSWTRLGGEASASGGVAEVWARDIATGAAMTVTYDPGGAGASGLGIQPRWYAGAKPLAQQPGATAVNAGGTAYATSITPTVVGSVLVGALGRASDAQTVVPNADTHLYGQFNGTSGDTAALFRARNVTSAAGPITLGFTNTPAGINRLALVEILPASAVQSSAESGLTALGLATIGTAVHVGQPAGAAPLGVTATGTARHIGASAGVAPLAVTATGTARKVAVQSGRCSLGLTSTGVAARRQAQTGTTALGLTAAGLARKVAPQAGPGPLGLTAAGRMTKVAVSRGVAPLGAATSGTAAKLAVFPAGGARAPVGLTTYHSTTIVPRAQSGTCAVGLGAYGAARKTAPTAGRAAVAVAVSGVAAKRCAAAGRATLAAATRTAAATGHGVAGRSFLGLSGTAAGRKVAAGFGAAPLGVAGAGQAVKRATPAGITVLALVTSGGLVAKRVSTSGAALVGLSTAYDSSAQVQVARLHSADGPVSELDGIDSTSGDLRAANAVLAAVVATGTFAVGDLRSGTTAPASLTSGNS